MSPEEIQSPQDEGSMKTETQAGQWVGEPPDISSLQSTYGEYLVEFNPGNNPEVDKIKRLAADLIDAIDQLSPREKMASGRQTSEFSRCKQLAIDRAEECALWAVKAATKPA